MRQMYELTSEDGVEGIVWPACLVLLRHLEDMDWCANKRGCPLCICDPSHPRRRGKRVLELGSGTGHLAVGLARLGAHVTATEGPGNNMAALKSWSGQLLREHVGGGQPLCTDPIRLSTGNSLGGTLELRELWWGEDFQLDAQGPFDVVSKLSFCSSNARMEPLTFVLRM